VVWASEGTYISYILGRVKKIFSQGDPAVYFVQSGRVKITVVSSAGKDAVLAKCWALTTFLVKDSSSANLSG